MVWTHCLVGTRNTPALVCALVSRWRPCTRAATTAATCFTSPAATQIATKMSIAILNIMIQPLTTARLLIAWEVGRSGRHAPGRPATLTKFSQCLSLLKAVAMLATCRMVRCVCLAPVCSGATNKIASKSTRPHQQIPRNSRIRPRRSTPQLRPNPILLLQSRRSRPPRTPCLEPRPRFRQL